MSKISQREARELNGLARRRWESNTAICYPIPLNVLYAWGNAVLVWLKHGGRIVSLNPREAYAQGLRDAKRAPNNQVERRAQRVRWNAELAAMRLRRNDESQIRRHNGDGEQGVRCSTPRPDEGRD